MAFRVKKRAKLTYYCEGDRPAVSPRASHSRFDEDLAIYFAGRASGHSATSVLCRDELVALIPRRKTPLVFACRDSWGPDAAIDESLRGDDIITMHADGSEPRAPSPLTDHGLTCRFTAHLEEVPNQAASCEVTGVALPQRSGAGAS